MKIDNEWRPLLPGWEHEITTRGFTVLPGVYTAQQVAETRAALEKALSVVQADDVSLRYRNGVVFAARNVVQIFPQALTIWQIDVLHGLLEHMLGAGYGLVRGLYFDKPPRQSWSLPWHKDLTIAVKEHQPSTGTTGQLTNPTEKAGVPHMEASELVLQQMLFLRIHLDDVTDENGPLQVLPGSHLSGKTNVACEQPTTTIHARAGDVLAIRPLVSHCSGQSKQDSQMHRRILHLEFSGDCELPDGYQWHFFQRADIV